MKAKLPWADRVSALTDPTVRNTLSYISQDGVLSLAGGIPAPSLFPAKKIDTILENFTEDQLREALQYSGTAGTPQLRQQLAEYLSQEWDQQIHPDQLLITTGSQQGLDLLGKAFLNKGDTVLVEDPTYLVAIQAYAGYEPEYTTVPLTETGPDIAALAEQAKQADPSFCYLIPTFQNPTGITWSKENRQQALEVIRENQLLVVEDNPYGELYFNQQSPQPLAALDKLQHTIYLGTFSKTLAPGLRVGFVVADPEIIDRLSLIKQGMDLHTSTLSQLIIAQLLEDKSWFQDHLAHLRDHYSQQAKYLLSSLDEHLSDLAEWNTPDGGMFVWLNAPGIKSDQLLLAAVDNGVAFMPGYPFYANEPNYQTLRLSYATTSKTEINTAVKKLAQTVKANS